MSKRCSAKLPFVITILLMLSQVACARSSHWSDCIDRQSCRELAADLRKHRPHDAHFASLLGEHLRGPGEMIDMGLIKEVDLFAHYEEISLSPLGRGQVRGIDLKRFNKLLFAPHSESDARSFLEKESSSYLILSGNEQLGGREFKKALQSFKKLLKQYPQHPKVVAGWARAKIGCRQYDSKLERRLKRAIKVSPRDFGLITEWINFLNHKEKDEAIDQIVERFEEQTIQGLDGSRLFTAFGRNYLRRERFDSAEKFLMKALNLDPKNRSAHLLLGQLHLHQKKNLPKAIASLRLSLDEGEFNEFSEVMMDIN